MSTNSEQTTAQQQKEVRLKLVMSAKMAKSDRITRETWETHPELKEVCSKYNLHPDILHHIAAFVWTFRR